MKEVLRWVVLGGLFLVPFVPLVVTNSLFFPYITGKAFAFRLVVEVIFAAWIILALIDIRYRPRFSWTLVAFGTLVGIVFLADILGASPLRSVWSNFERMGGLVSLVHLLLFFIVAVSVLTTEKLWRRFWQVSLAAASFVALYATGQLIGGGSAYSGARIDATLGNAIYMAVYMLFHVFLALLLFVQEKRIGLRTLYGVLALVFTFFLIQTETRGTALGLAGGLAATALYAVLFAHGARRMRAVAMGGLLLLVLFGGALFLARDTAFITERPALDRIASISLAEGETRLTIWSMALEGWQERPLLGWGQANFSYVFNEYYRPSLYAQEPWFDRAHNVYLDWLVAAGALGLLAYLALWGSALYAVALRPLVRKGDVSFGLAERAILTGLLVGYGIHNIFVFDNLVSYLFFACVLAYVHVRTTAHRSPLSSRALPKEVAYLAAPVVGVLLCVAIYYGNIVHIRAAGELLSGLSYASAATPELPVAQQNALALRGLAHFENALAQGSPIAIQETREQLGITASRIYRTTTIPVGVRNAYQELAEAELEAQVTERPKDARSRMFLGSFYRAVGKHEEALREFAAAHELSPRKPHILLDIGATHLDRGEYDFAQEAFEDALALAPENRTAREYAMIAAIYRADDIRFAELSEAPYEDLAQNSDLVLQTYYQLGQFSAVLRLLDARIAQDREDVQSWVSKAAVQHETGDTAAAIRTLEQAMVVNPSFASDGRQLIRQMQSGAI